MGDSTQADAPEGWIFLPEAVERFMELSSEPFPLDRNPLDGGPQNAGDELSASIDRSYSLRECERQIDRSRWGVLTNSGSVEPTVDRDAICHGLFDLKLGILGRTLDRPGLHYGLSEALANILIGVATDVRTHESELPDDLERYRDCHVVLHAEAWKGVIRAWRAEENATRQRRHGHLIDFTGVSDDYLGRLIVGAFELASRSDLRPSRKRMCEAFMEKAVAGTLRKRQFRRVWTLFGVRPENRHLRMSAPGTKASRRPKK